MTDTTKTELEQLKAQADEMGLVYAKNVTTKTLKNMIARELLKQSGEDDSEEIKQVENENLKLRHVIITPMDSLKRGMSHETFSVGNAVLGTITRVVPFGQPWLIEQALYNHIKEKEFHLMTTVKDTMNPLKETVESRLVPAYTIQDLPLPTEAEIAELAKRQAARDAVE